MRGLLSGVSGRVRLLIATATCRAGPGSGGAGAWLVAADALRRASGRGLLLADRAGAPNLWGSRQAGSALAVRRWQAGGASQEPPRKHKADKGASDPGLFLFKAAFMGSLAYCGMIVYPSVRDSMVDSGAALMRSKSPMFAAQGMSRVRAALKSREKCEATFGRSGSEPNKTTLALIKHLESPDREAQSEALALSLKLVELGCSSLLADAGAGDVLRRLEKAGGADSRVGDALRAISSPANTRP